MSFHATQIPECVERGDILIKYNYTELCDVVEELHSYEEYEEMVGILGDLYVILDMGTLIQDSANRLEIEKKWMTKGGFTNVT